MRLDHIVLLTRSLDNLAIAFERLGFLLTPLGDHGPRFATVNRCVMFEDHYIELLGVRAETPDNAPLRGLLEHSTAVSLIGIRSDDIDRTYRELRARGIPAQPPLHSSRDMEAGAVDVSRVEFSVVMLPTPQPSAELPAFFCMQKTPEAIFSARWRKHPNGATRLFSVEVEAHDPDAAAAAYARLGASIKRDGERRIVLHEGASVALVAIGCIPQVSNSASLGRASALRVAVPDLDVMRSMLDRQQVAFREAGGGLIVDCWDGRRCAISFIAA